MFRQSAEMTAVQLQSVDVTRDDTFLVESIRAHGGRAGTRLCLRSLPTQTVLLFYVFCDEESQNELLHIHVALKSFSLSPP